MEDATKDEEYELLLRKVGPTWSMKIMQEEEKRNRGKYGVKVNRVLDSGVKEMEELVQRKTGEKPKSGISEKNAKNC